MRVNLLNDLLLFSIENDLLLCFKVGVHSPTRNDLLLDLFLFLSKGNLLCMSLFFFFPLLIKLESETSGRIFESDDPIS